MTDFDRCDMCHICSLRPRIALLYVCAMNVQSNDIEQSLQRVIMYSQIAADGKERGQIVSRPTVTVC